MTFALDAPGTEDRRWNAAILDAVQLLGTVEPTEIETAKRMLVRMVEMLSRMCR